jgi:type IV pilus assembly protein PilQ
MNSVLLTGNSLKVESILQLLQKLDKAVPNVMIEVIVVEARKSFNLETGIKAFVSDSVPKSGGQVLGGIDYTLSSNSINEAISKVNTNGLVNLGKVTPNFYITLKAMEDDGIVDIKSTPKLSTLNGHEATMTIGESRYYLEVTQNITGGVTPITTSGQRFSKVEANNTIKINPIVSGNDHVTLKIEAEFSSFLDPTIQGAPPGNATRNFTSQVRVRNDDMIVLGGLEDIRNSKSSSGMPVLSKIPVLSWFFSTKKIENSNSKLVIFIRPSIIY